MEKAWWKESVVYQIYPRSFKDSNGDGIGDLKGIIEKLDYLKKLGVNVLWLSPIYSSPNDDNGYDISNYRDIMKEFGTIQDFDLLLSEAHKRGLKIMMDLVVNHTSDEHKWFVESKKSKHNKYRDFYIWREGKGKCPPNNWGSVFGGSAWELSPETGMYYLHMFSKKQPDLNWTNQNVRSEIYDMMKWWLDKGIDGFRMDVICMISKDMKFPDGLKNENDVYGNAGPYCSNRPQVHEYLQEMNREVLSKYDLMTVGETPRVTPKDAVKYAGRDRNELNMVFQFEHMSIDHELNSKWDSRPFKLIEFKKIMSKWQNELEGKAWNSLYLNNHDQPRMVSRFGDDGKYRVESAKMLATCIHMMKGTPYIYQGEEIGMTNVKFDKLDDYRDLETFNAYKFYTETGKKTNKEMMEAIYKKSRDNARTPFQWDNTQNAGFTTGTPWIKANPNYSVINAEEEVNDNDSIFNYYRKLIKLRKENEIIVYGKYRLLLENDKNIYAYLRELNDEKLLVICNFSKGNCLFKLPQEIKYKYKEILISNYNIDDMNIENITLKPYETRAYKLK